MKKGAPTAYSELSVFTLWYKKWGKTTSHKTRISSGSVFGEQIRATKGEEVKIAVLVIDHDGTERMISGAAGCWDVAVWKYREIGRLSVQRKCQSVKVGWYQMTEWQQQPPRLVASEKLRHPDISLGPPPDSQFPFHCPEATLHCAGLSESPSILSDVRYEKGTSFGCQVFENTNRLS